MSKFGLACSLFATVLFVGCEQPIPPDRIGFRLEPATNLIVVDAGAARSAQIPGAAFPAISGRLTFTNYQFALDTNYHSGAIVESTNGLLISYFLPAGSGKMDLDFSHVPHGQYPLGDTLVKAYATIRITNVAPMTDLVGPRWQHRSVASTNFTVRVINSFVPPTPPATTPPAEGFTNLTSFGGTNPIAHAPWNLIEGVDGLLHGVSLPLNPSSPDSSAVVKFDRQGLNARTLLTNTAAFSNSYGGPFVAQLVSTWDFIHQTNLLVGATFEGGTHPTNGIVFGLHEDGTHFRPLTSFRFQTIPPLTGQDGFRTRTLTKDRGGRIIGSTSGGGRLEIVFYGGGVLFDIWSTETSHTVLQRFGPETAKNFGAIFGSDGRLYGVAASQYETWQSGYTGGALFSTDWDGGFLVTTAQFPQPPTNTSFGGGFLDTAPRGGLVEHTNGFLYGAHGYAKGWLDSPHLRHTNMNYFYRVAKGSGSIQVLRRFSEAPGFQWQTPAPEALVQGPDGKLYGFLVETNNLLVALHPDTGELEVVQDLGPAGSSGNALHTHTTGALLLASDGSLYGTVLVGGENNRGYLFRYRPPAIPPPVARELADTKPEEPKPDSQAGGTAQRNGSSNASENPGFAPMATLTLPTNYPGLHVGRALALTTNRLVVGVPYSSDPDYKGAAHVFLRNGNEWNLESTLQPAGGDNVRWFGLSAAFDGTNLVVGAPGYLDTNLFAGAAYVFSLTNNTWLQTAKLAGQNLPGDEFGNSVALNGNYLIVGAPGQTNLGPHTGAAWIYQRVSGTWTFQGQFFGNNARSNRYFGASVAINGAFAAVGAPMGRETDSPVVRGEVHVFRRAPLWELLIQLDSQYGYGGDYFGASLAMAPDRIVAGMPGSLPVNADDLKADRRGVCVFARQGTLWIEKPRIVPDQVRALEMFGASVAFDGSLVTVGAPHDPEFYTEDTGATYVFTLAADAGSSSQLARLRAPESDPSDAFGLSVAQAGKLVAVAAPLQPNTNALSGAVHLFDLTAPILDIHPAQNGVLLKWHSFYSDFTLQASPALGPDANWQSVQPPPVGTSYFQTPTNAARFYRLAKP